MVISSTGGAAQHQGQMLGQFEYNEISGYYQQTSTEQGHENFDAIYLYPLNDGKWQVAIQISSSEMAAFLLNPGPSRTIPTSGWQYSDGKSYQDDPTLTITPGPLPPLARQFRVTATGAAAEK